MQQAAVFRAILQQIAIASHVHRGVGDNGFTRGIDGRVGDLGKHLLEVIEQGALAFVQHGQRRVNSHGGGGFNAGFRHGEQHGVHVFVGIAERAPQACQLVRVVIMQRALWLGQFFQLDKLAVKPFAVGMLGGVAFFNGLVVFHHAGNRVYYQHAARFQALLGNDMLIGNIKNAHFRGKNQAVIVGHVIARGAQAVAVKCGAHHFAIGEQQRRRAIPRLHHGGVVMEHVAACYRDVCVLAPGLRHQHHYGFWQFNAGKHEELQRIVQHGAVGTRAVNHGHHAFHVVLELRAAHGFLARVHAVKVAANRVDFAVVQQHAVGMRSLPAGVRVRGKAGMHQGNGALAARILQVGVKLAQLLHQEHAFVDHGAAAKRCHIASFGYGRLLELAAYQVEQAVKAQARFHVAGTHNQCLIDGGHAIACLLSQDVGVRGNFAPRGEGNVAACANAL